MSGISGPVPDPLASPVLPERLAFNDGALLTAGHFQLEQLYHRARLGRVLAYLHGNGTIAGLDVTIATPPTGSEVRVAPGLALDRLGRLVELTTLSCLRIAPWFDQTVADPLGNAQMEAARRDAGGGLPEHVEADVYIAYLAAQRVPEPAFATANADEIDAVRASRVLDGARLTLLIRQQADNRLPAATVTTPAGTPEVMRTAIRDAKRLHLWDGLRLDGDPPHLPSGGTVTEHDPLRQDGTEVFLARLILPVARDGGGVLRVDPGQVAQVRQDARLYVYSTAELALFSALGR